MGILDLPPLSTGGRLTQAAIDAGHRLLAPRPKRKTLVFDYDPKYRRTFTEGQARREHDRMVRNVELIRERRRQGRPPGHNPGPRKS